ncbi:MAG: helix-turn-helix domain-containing protein [Firmicutes bacterium]|nr:helix-turn-helix domain-containing protein [Bacillota bacterium]
MTKSKIGKIIKERRCERGVTQTELCRGICSKSMLSRIENGNNIGGADVLAMLLERLGLGSEILGETTDLTDYLVYQKIRGAERLFFDGEKAEALGIIDALGKEYDSFSPENRQRYDALETVILFEDGVISLDRKLENLEKSLSITVEGFGVENLPPLMTRTEIHLLGFIAETYFELGNVEIAVRILYHTKNFVEANVEDTVAASEMLSEICRHLSRYLGTAGNYSECANVAREGIKRCKYAKDNLNLVFCLYNRALALRNLGDPRDSGEVTELANEALLLCVSGEADADSPLLGCIRSLLSP